MIFDPDTSQVLATETTALPGSGADEPTGPTLLRATVYEEARGTHSLSEKEGMWLSGFEPSAYRRSGRQRVPDLPRARQRRN